MLDITVQLSKTDAYISFVNCLKIVKHVNKEKPKNIPTTCLVLTLSLELTFYLEFYLHFTYLLLRH